MPQHKWPYQNTDLDTMRGERWKDIPGLEMYFLISNYGRVKRQEYELEYCDGRLYMKPEKIIKPVLQVSHNGFIGDDTPYLVVAMTLFKVKHHFSIMRLVYHCFVERFPLDDRQSVILAKDRNPLNVRPSNLRKATLSEKQNRIAELDRKGPILLSSEQKEKRAAAFRKLNSRQVSQYDPHGRKIRTYRSVRTAAQQTGVNESHISNRARGIEWTAGGYFWRYGIAAKIDLTPMLSKVAERKRRTKEQIGIKVTQYDMKGRRIAIFPTIRDAAESIGTSRATISGILTDKRSSAGGFYWVKGAGPKKIDLSRHEYGETLRAKRRSQPVEQYSIQGKYIRTFDSIKKAAAVVSVAAATLVAALLGRQETSGGFKWKYLK